MKRYHVETHLESVQTLAAELLTMLRSSNGYTDDQLREQWDYLAHDMWKIEAYMHEGEVDG